VTYLHVPPNENTKRKVRSLCGFSLEVPCQDTWTAMVSARRSFDPPPRQQSRLFTRNTLRVEDKNRPGHAAEAVA